MESLGTVAGRRSIEVIRDMVPGVDERRLAKALSYAFMLYGDRTMDLLPQITFYDHAVRTAQLLAEFCPDEDAIIAAILQHALKVPEASIAEIGKEFGRPVRDIVSRIHLLSHLYTTDWRKSVDDMKIMLVSVADDIRVLLTALSVACVLMEQLEHVKSEYRMRLCRQSLQLFAPVAARLGIYALKYRLEKSAFPECYPTDAQHIGLQIKRLHTEHGQFLERSAERLKTFLHEQGIEAQVMARQKQSYSIFQKMHSKSVTALEKITDLFAIRVVVKTVPDCYQTLGLIHQLATPISHRFKDYISFPKPNGYQSLHTCLIGLPEAPDDVMIEVQIRTADMHREAEYGIAAHWMYKEHGRNRVMNSVKQMELSDVLLKQQSVSGDAQAGEGMTLVDHIYVLTPRGDIIELPDGGTPLDFAFTLHTDLGLKYKAARVNGGIVPISYKLENGDVIEILTNKHPRPTLQWLEELVTPSGRSKLKAYFFSHNRSQFLTKGKDAVNAELKIRGQLPLDTELSAVAHYEGKTITQKEREDLLVKVGMGSVRTSSILRHIPQRSAQTMKSRTAKATAAKKDRVGIEGHALTMPYRFAKCCSPDQSDPKPERIMGIVTRNGVVNVHRSGCRMVKASDPERKLKMFWKV
ncbi:MAG: bifunctional (p)ppGpp synthetase/guanosine-3',5'-bis(diphosphate) 3'-pyrophosphohydrolase [Candidatus Peribacteraceae bacterium]|nr:bifunctional (p)ppGpp synthetase/guanosine-3',5'-bis(diphosphate) 3'-pyrophosphohydrolase [Candidatus Peribacteraceae bacterium]